MSDTHHIEHPHQHFTTEAHEHSHSHEHSHIPVHSKNPVHGDHPDYVGPDYGHNIHTDEGSKFATYVHRHPHEHRHSHHGTSHNTASMDGSPVKVSLSSQSIVGCEMDDPHTVTVMAAASHKIQEGRTKAGPLYWCIVPGCLTGNRDPANGDFLYVDSRAYSTKGTTWESEPGQATLWIPVCPAHLDDAMSRT